MQVALGWKISKVEQDSIKAGQEHNFCNATESKTLLKNQSLKTTMMLEHTLKNYLEVNFAVGEWSINLATLCFEAKTLLRCHKYRLGVMGKSKKLSGQYSIINVFISNLYTWRLAKGADDIWRETLIS